MFFNGLHIWLKQNFNSFLLKIPQPGVPPEKAGATVAVESSTGTWTIVGTLGTPS